ncbi:uncharacterized protein LOC102891942, partial [Pteropus alecto]|uniref:uncharacterized protein LOC102891942 n=1 Tax=Pteropus alecto TaxID=9402 RepID=UPI000D53A3EE
MATRLLCCVALGLLGVVLSPATEATDAQVTQLPGHKVTKRGQEVTLSCEPISGHAALYWYRQTWGQGLELLIYFRNQAPVDDKGMPNARFSAVMPSKSNSTLKIQATEPEDSATYLCASSLATALQSHPLPVQKPSGFPFPLQPPAVLSSLQSKGVGWCFNSPSGRQQHSTPTASHPETFRRKAIGDWCLSFLANSHRRWLSPRLRVSVTHWALKWSGKLKLCSCCTRDLIEAGLSSDG